MKAFIDAPLLVYLNTLTDSRHRALYEHFFIDALTKYKIYVDALVLDELIYVSSKKYGVPYSVSLEFIESAILPYITLLPLGEDEYRYAAEVLRKHSIKPSDALHIGAMKSNGINIIISEDKEFDKIPDITRLWIE